VRKAVTRSGGKVDGRDADELLAALVPRRGPERLLDFMLRTGPYGDGFGTDPDGLSLQTLLDHPHGVDLGPLQPRIPECLRTPSGMIELAPEPLIDDVDRLRAALSEPAAGHRNGNLLLVGRRDLRSNNSWMHNVDVLVKGKDRCTVHVHPDDAARNGIADGAAVVVASVNGRVELSAEVTDAIMPGVVSIPHGWGHDVAGSHMQIAARRPGVNSNVLAGTDRFDPLSGNAVLNGIPVTLTPA
jgi:anaerobic selenocysteine-containing dehydrogenase